VSARSGPVRKRNLAVALIASILSLTFLISPWAAAQDVVINEIAWMGTLANAGDEWIELHNTTPFDIDISGWSIYGADTYVCLNFSDADGHTTWVIPAHGYLIYANHPDDVKDSSGNDMATIWDATISLNNTNPGQLILYDGPDCTGNVIDTANQIVGAWYAGDANGRRTMERKESSASGEDPSNWASNDPAIAANGLDSEWNPLLATPGARNSATNEPPVADPGVSRTVVRGLEVQLDGSASFDPDGDPLSYTWSFTARPTGSTASMSDPIAVDPTFIADVHGEYRVDLAVEDDHGGSDSAQVIIVVHAPPTADFTVTPYPPTTWDILSFTDQSSDPDGTIVAWSWNFGDGTSSSDQDPFHQYGLPSTYACTLEVLDDDGLTHSSASAITVLMGPGDVDGDEAITLLDVRLCLQIATGVIPGTAAQRMAADVDGDGDVDEDDAQRLARHVIGLAD